MASVSQQISGLTVSEGGKLFAGYNNTVNNIYNRPCKQLPYATQAEFNASGKEEDDCLPNTRVDILGQIRSWVDGDDESSIFWLSGWAGTGKSIIARTISRIYHDKGREGKNFFASFFFSRGEKDVSDTSKFVTSIAVQLRRSPLLRDRIDEATLDDDGIADKILRDQWKQLIIEPLSKLNTESVRKTLVLVIDALDECDREGDINRVIQLLPIAGALQTVRLRVLITSRPETDIRDGFSQFLHGVYQEFILHDISKSVVDHDIFIFFSNKFGHTVSTDWPDEQTIKRLVQKAAGLFIWAATAYRFIYEGRKSFSIAKKRLHRILQSDGSVTKPEAELNKIYITVLQSAIDPDYDEEDKESVYETLRKILGSIVILFSPLSADSLASLINLPGEDLKKTLGHLHAILDVPRGRACPIRLHHPSFRDFFLDNKRCTDRQLQVDGQKAHWALATSCIRLMSELLKKDICNLRLPGTLAGEIDDEKIEQCIPMELQYACNYWVHHFHESNSPLLDNGEVHLFLLKYLLFWLEALSLLGKISEGIFALISLENLVKADQSPCLYNFIHDAKRFALNFRSTIETAPLQIYISALFFAPEMSLVRMKYKSLIPHWITGVTKAQKDWSPLLQTLEGHFCLVEAVVFSPDGKLIASGSNDNTVRLWDSSTGAALQTLKGHSGFVTAVMFSPDGKLVASTSWDTTIRLWNSSTGIALHIFKGHSSFVGAVLFSPNGKLLASASQDSTVRLWDPSTGAVLQILEGHTGTVEAIMFSPDGKLVASASEDKTVRLWDSSTGAAMQILKGHSSLVEAVVFSPNGMLVASGSRDTTVKLWNWSTGAVLQTLEGHSDLVRAVVFSPDGKLVASASYDMTVRLWDTSTGMALQTLKGHSALVEAVAFSSNGKLLASASADSTVRLWDSSTGIALQTLEGHSAPVQAVMFSPDSKLVLSASEDNTVRLWDSSTGAVPHLMDGHSALVRAVSFSPDGKLVASASRDNMVRLWDSFSGTALQLLEGHSDTVNAVAFSPDGKLIASGSRDTTVRLWGSSAGAALQTLEGHSSSVLAINFSPDGKIIASASEDHTVRLWDSSTGAVLQTLEGHSELVTAVMFSPDGKLVASGSWDDTVRLWDSSTGAVLQTLKGHLDFVTAVALSPDGKLIASASCDYTVKLWNLSTGILLQTFYPLMGIHRLSFSDDGSYIITNKGLLRAQPVSTHPCSHHQPVMVFDRWIVGAMGKLLWLPPDYQASSSDVRDSSVVLGHRSGCMSFIQFDLSQLA